MSLPKFHFRRRSHLLICFILLIAASIVLHNTALPSIITRTSATTEANIAYFLQISPATLSHLPRLFHRLYHPQNVYAIHFDVAINHTSVQTTMRLLQNLIPSLNTNTYLIPSQPIVYNGISMTLNTLAAMSFFLNLPNEWHFFINLSGSDYPLTTPTLPRRLLATALPYAPNFFSFGHVDKWNSTFYARASQLFFDDMLAHGQHPVELHSLRRSNPIVPKLTFVPAYTEAWLIASLQFCHYATSSPQARKLLLTFSNMRGSDEFFFASLAYNNPVFNRSIVPHAMRRVVWSADGVHAGQHPYYLDERTDDQKWRFLPLLKSSFQFHARKFRIPDSQLMDIIDDMADGKARVARYYKNFGRLVNRLKIRYHAGNDAVTNATLLGVDF